MKPQKETREERFRRLAEARVNKLLQLFRLLGNLSWTGTYAYTREQVEQIFTTLQLELVQTKIFEATVSLRLYRSSAGEGDRIRREDYC